MSITSGNIITVNTGSSSIKLAIFRANQYAVDKSPSLAISISNIGQPTGTLQVTQPDTPPRTKNMGAVSHAEASRIIIAQLIEEINPASILAIGHRLVHGGMKYVRPTVIETIPETDWELLSQLDPEHTPAARELIAQFSSQYPSILQVACFDTAFFENLPRVATVIPIPRKYYDQGVRRYGFHGLSYTSLLAAFEETAGNTAMNGRVILAHLGSGASVTATYKAKPVDTTMGFTPTSGILMSTRSGDLDPNIFSFLHARNGMSVDEFNHMVNSQSGLLGISHQTGDIRALLDIEGGDSDAAMAVELFVRDVRKSIGSLATTLGGIDSLIFSGGMGEQSMVLRARICQGLEYMGIKLDENANTQNAFLISSDQSSVGVHVIPANEAYVIALQVHTAHNIEGE